MIARWICLLLLSVTCTLSGCALCCSPYDEDYMSVGGKHQRTDMVRGRMGSVLSDPSLRPQYVGPQEYSQTEVETYDSEVVEDDTEYTSSMINDEEVVYEDE